MSSAIAPWKSYDDIVVGSSFVGHGRTVTEADVLIYTALTAGFHQPIHTDLEFVRKRTGFSERLLPGPAIISYSIGLLSGTLVYRDITVAFAGLDKVRARAPVFPGDTITPHATIASKRVTSDGERGLVTFSVEVRKAGGEVAMTYEYLLMVAAR